MELESAGLKGFSFTGGCLLVAEGFLISDLMKMKILIDFCFVTAIFRRKTGNVLDNVHTAVSGLLALTFRGFLIAWHPELLYENGILT